MEAVKFLLDEAEETLSSLNGTEPSVYSAVYLVKTNYHNKVGPASKFYDAALQYLSYTPLEEVTNAVELATNLALAALVGDNVYNFGEILATPILNSIEGTPFGWLGDLIRACNAGDIKKFNEICALHKSDIDSQPILKAKENETKKKIALLALVELIFHRPANNRIIAFTDIAKATSLPVNQVEWLIMKAMSIGLIRGVVDEIDQEVRVSWVQPRVLNQSQMESLKEKIATWSLVTEDTLNYVKNNTTELLN